MANHQSTPVTVSLQAVQKIHQHLTLEFIDSGDPISPPGMRDLALLASAVGIQETGFGGIFKYQDVHLSAAALMYAICSNHAFHNGNKRAALLSGLLHLDLNGYMLHGATNGQLYEVMRRLAAHELLPPREGKRSGRPIADEEVADLARWLKEKSRKVVKGERSITYGRLYEILQEFKYRLGEKRHNKIEVLMKKASLFGSANWKCVYKVGCPGDSRTISFQEIKQIRQALKLTEEDGVDSYSFYGEQTLIDEHIRDNRTVLRRLARI